MCAPLLAILVFTMTISCECPFSMAARLALPIHSFKGGLGFIWIFSFYVRYSTLLHLPPLRFHCVGGCWDRTQDSCDYGIGSHDTLTTRLDLIHHSA
jgi:hypothetical protein